jgi:Triosephosphate isomerase
VPSLHACRSTLEDPLKQELAKLGLAKQVGILYGGGSVDDVSIQELVKLQQVDGFLIGGASLKPEKFKTIAQVVGVPSSNS